MKLTLEQTNKILQKLRDYECYVVDVEDCAIVDVLKEVDKGYFNEKVNEVLEEVE